MLFYRDLSQLFRKKTLVWLSSIVADLRKNVDGINQGFYFFIYLKLCSLLSLRCLIMYETEPFTFPVKFFMFFFFIFYFFGFLLIWESKSESTGKGRAEGEGRSRLLAEQSLMTRGLMPEHWDYDLIITDWATQTHPPPLQVLLSAFQNAHYEPHVNMRAQLCWRCWVFYLNHSNLFAVGWWFTTWAAK